MKDYIIIHNLDELTRNSYLIWEQILCRIPLYQLENVTVRFLREQKEGYLESHIGQLVWEYNEPMCPTCLAKLNPPETQ